MVLAVVESSMGGRGRVAMLLLLLLLQQLLLLLLADESAQNAQRLHSLGQHFQYSAREGVDCLSTISAPDPSSAVSSSEGVCWDPTRPSERAAAAAASCGYCAMQCYLAARGMTATNTTGLAPDYDYNGMLNDLGLLLAAHDDYSGAVAVFGEAAARDPTAAPPLVNWAGVEVSLLHFDEADALYSRALALLSRGGGDSATHAKVLYNYGVLLQKRGAISDADASYAAALHLDPQGMYLAQGNLACNLCRRGTAESIEQAQQLFIRAITSAYATQDFRNALTMAFQMASGVTPVIHTSSTDILPYRRRLAQGLIDFAASPLLYGQLNPYDMVGPSAMGYYTIYNGYEDIYLRQLQAAAYWKAASTTLSYTAPFLSSAAADGRLVRLQRRGVAYTVGGESLSLLSLAVPSHADASAPSGQLSVGFVSAFFFHHSVGLLLRGVIKGLAARSPLLRVYIFCVGQRSSDSVTDQLRAAVGDDNFYYLTGSLHRMRAQIAAVQLDVLVYGEVGMDMSTYFLSFARLARRSLLFWGHAVTSGVTRPMEAGGSIGPDYFVSSSLFEGSGVAAAQDEYSERLLLLRGLVTSFERPPPPLSPQEFAEHGGALTGRSFLLSLDASLADRLPARDEPLVLLGVPQTLYKMHPDFDDIIASILAADPAFRLVLLSGSEPLLAEATRLRLRLRLGQELFDKVLFTGLLDERQFITLCSLLDVALDPFPVGGGRSSLEILSTGTPIVMLYNRTSILQLTHAMYTVMGIDTSRLVASSGSEYAALVISLGRDAAGTALLREQIASRSHRLYADGPSGEATIDEWQKALLFVCAAPRPIPRSLAAAPASTGVEMWVREERSAAVLSYHLEPLELRRVHMALYLSPSGELQEACFFVPTRLLEGGDDPSQQSDVESPAYFEQAFSIDGRMALNMLVVAEEGWERRCLLAAAQALPHASNRLTALSVCATAGRHILSGDSDLVRRFGLLLRTGSVDAYLPVAIHKGTDLNLLFTTLQSDLGKFMRLHNDVFRAAPLPESDLLRALGDSYRDLRAMVAGLLPGGLEGLVLRRRAYDRVFMSHLQVAPLPGLEDAVRGHIAGAASDSGALLGDEAGMEVGTEGAATVQAGRRDVSITLALTTCRRVDKFSATMDSLIAAFASARQPLPGPLVSHVLVVDDGSPEEEQQQMARSYGSIAQFILKSPDERGHASSLNMIVSMVSTRFLLLVEDDMLLLSRPELHPLLRTCLLNGRAAPTEHPFVAALEAAARELRRGHVHQLLFNSQVSRECAEGAEDCALGDISRGGWPANGSAVPYSLHEFAAADSSSWDTAADARIHAFSYWPGLSLNPGLWDLQEVLRLGSCCSSGRLFAQQDPSVLFEQAFSALSLAAGLRMGYLPAVFFRHIGDVSAYVLSETRRPTDRRSSI